MQISIIFEFYADFRSLWMISLTTLNRMISYLRINYLKIEVTFWASARRIGFSLTHPTTPSIPQRWSSII